MKPSAALAASGSLREVVAVDDDAARGGLEQARDDADGRGLARAVRPQEAVDLAGGRRRGDTPSTAVKAAVLLDEVLDLDHASSADGRDQQAVAPSRLGQGEVRGAAGRGPARPTRIGVEPGRTSHLEDAHLRAADERAGWRPAGRGRRGRGATWVASAGNWLRVGSTGSQSPRPRPSCDVDLGPGVVVEGAAQVDEADRDPRGQAQRRAPWPRRAPCARCSRRPGAQHLERGGQAHRRLLLEERVHVAHQALRHAAAAPWRPRRAFFASATISGASLSMKGSGEPGTAAPRIGARPGARLARRASRPRRPSTVWPAPWTSGPDEVARPRGGARSRSTVVGSSMRARAASGTMAAVSSMSIWSSPGTASASRALRASPGPR